MESQERFAIIKYIVDKLGDVGKTKIQKLIYILQNVFNIPIGYIFKIHYFGPYSEILDDDLIDMKLHELLSIEPSPDGYGYHINSMNRDDSSLSLNVKFDPEKLNRCLEIFGDLSISDLELLSTIHFVKNTVKNRKDVIDKVAILKPKFNRDNIADSYDELERKIKEAIL